jgi:bifunctional non-homologous end joining protein LigD
VSVSWTERRAVLESLQLTGESWATVPVLDGALADIVHACHDLDLEGVVLKRRGSLYRPGERSKDWIKVKTPDWREHHAARRHER